ncbi:MAG: AMP-binding protein [Desulfomonilaceae bacterium]
MNITLRPMRFLDRAATLFGSTTAVVCEGRRWTYTEFNERANRLSNALVRLGYDWGIG